MARSLDTGDDGNTGHLRLGVDASLDHIFGTVDYMHHLTDTPVGEMSAFARGFGGARRLAGRWERDLGVTGGLELRW